MSGNDLIKGRARNHLTWLAPDATDFASPESALSAAQKIRIYGKLESSSNVHFVSSGTGSMAGGDIKHVGPSVLGMYTVALTSADLSDASAAWYTQYTVVISAAGMANQVFVLDGGIEMSRLLALSDAVSNVLSAVLLTQSMASDAASAAAQANSRTLLLVSSVSDLQSAVTVVQSMASDAASAAAQGNSRVLLVQSRLSDFDSRIVSDISDIRSMLTALSDAISDAHSDLGSKIGAVTATVSASDMSDIASRVDVLLASRLSDILSAAQQTNSRVLVVQSMVSDVQSVVSNINSIAGASPTASDIASQTYALLASQLSDALSAAQQTNSRVLLNQSRISDIASYLVAMSGALSDVYSQLSDFRSDLGSLVTTTGVGLNASTMSDIRSAIAANTPTLSASDISDIASAVAAQFTLSASAMSDIASQVWAHAVGARVDSRVLLVLSNVSDVQSAVAVVQSMASDAASAAQQTNSRVLLNLSRVSDVYSMLSDLQSDFQSRVPKAVANNSQVSALLSDVLSALAAGVPVSASDMSDIRSAIAAGTLTQSAISDIASAVGVELASRLSDILSAAQQGNSRVLVTQSAASDASSGVTQALSRLAVIQSQASDIYSLVSDLHSDVGAGVELGASSLSDLRSAITANGVLRAGADVAGGISPTATLADKVDWLTGLSRNKRVQTTSQQKLYDDSGNQVASAVVSADADSTVFDEWAG